MRPLTPLPASLLSTAQDAHTHTSSSTHPAQLVTADTRAAQQVPPPLYSSSCTVDPASSVVQWVVDTPQPPAGRVSHHSHATPPPSSVYARHSISRGSSMEQTQTQAHMYHESVDSGGAGGSRVGGLDSLRVERRKKGHYRQVGLCRCISSFHSFFLFRQVLVA